MDWHPASSAPIRQKVKVRDADGREGEGIKLSEHPSSSPNGEWIVKGIEPLANPVEWRPA